MWRHIASNAITLFVVLLVLLGGVIIWGKDQFSGDGPLAGPICFRVESGASLRTISNNLEGRGAISSATLFRVGSDYTGKSGQQKRGSYLIKPGASMETILDQITTAGRSTCGTEITYRIGVLRGQTQVRELDPATNRYEELAAFDPVNDAVPDAYGRAVAQPDTRYRVVLAEGVTSWQVTEALKASDFLTGDLDVPAEGSLAPDSYEVLKGAERADLVARMQAAQENILEELWQGRTADLPIDTPEQALILASIVEKETGVPEERGQVASVFVNRLNRGIRL